MTKLFEKQSYGVTFLCDHKQCRKEFSPISETKEGCLAALIRNGWIIRTPGTIDKDHERKTRHYCQEHAEAHYHDYGYRDGKWVDADEIVERQAQAQAAMPNDLAVAHIKPVKPRAKKGVKK